MMSLGLILQLVCLVIVSVYLYQMYSFKKEFDEMEDGEVLSKEISLTWRKKLVKGQILLVIALILGVVGVFL